MEYHIIINPAAGKGAGQKSEQQLLKLCKEHFGEFQLHKTEAPGHAAEIAKKSSSKNSIIIAVGGDGTVHDVVNGMVESEATLGIIPLGSGNDFVKMLNLPLDIKSAIEVIQKNKTMMTDVGKVNERFFPNGIGMGFDAVVVMEALKRKYAKGFLIYLFSVFRAMRYYQNHKITLHLNGTVEIRDIFMINVGNGKVLGGGFRLTPAAEIDDGQLDVCLFNPLSKGEILRHLPKAISGKHIYLPQVEMHKTTKLIIESEDGIPIHADGELLSSNLKRVEIQVVPKSLRVIHNLQN